MGRGTSIVTKASDGILYGHTGPRSASALTPDIPKYIFDYDSMPLEDLMDSYCQELIGELVDASQALTQEIKAPEPDLEANRQQAMRKLNQVKDNTLYQAASVLDKHGLKGLDNQKAWREKDYRYKNIDTESLELIHQQTLTEITKSGSVENFVAEQKVKLFTELEEAERTQIEACAHISQTLFEQDQQDIIQ